jgi:HEAT repeat protein
MVMPAVLEVASQGAWLPAARAGAPWVLGMWLAGVLVALGRLVRDIRHIARLTRRAAVLCRGPLHHAAAEIGAQLGLERPVRVALSREIEVPVASGLLHPVVLLPAAARRWSSERRRVVLRHELAHIRRRDYGGHLLFELACAMHWPNPLAWRAARWARLEQEQACDDRVLALGTGPVEYAEHLLDIARTFALPGGSPRGALAMAAAATLPSRMRAILDGRLDHRLAGRRTALAVGAAAMLLGMPTAALHPWSDGPRDRELMARLESPNPVARRDAIWTLGAQRAGGAKAAITRRLGDDDAATRGVAAWALGKLGDRAALAPLTAALHDPDANVREMAVLALGELRDARAVPALEGLAGDPEPGVRSVMTVALQQIQGEPAAEALGRLARSDPDPHTRVMAAGALSKFRSRARVPALESALADPEPDVRANAAASLERVGGDASVPALVAALGRETDPEACDAMMRALGASGDHRAVNGLIQELGDTIPELRQSAAEMLGRVGDDRAVDHLIAATRDPDHKVRLTAVWALDALQRGR